jgi:hypothetical protein
MIRAIELQVELQLRFFQLQVMLQLGTNTSGLLDYFVIHANSELQHELQLRYDVVILLSHKLLLNRLSPIHTHKNLTNSSILKIHFMCESCNTTICP